MKTLCLVGLLMLSALIYTPKSFALEEPVTDKDKAAVVKSMLEMRLGDYEKEWLEELFLSTENIKPEWVPKIKGVTLKVLKPDGIKEKLNQPKVSCLIFTQFEVNGSKIMVTLESRSSGGFSNSQTYEYSKQNGKWEGAWRGLTDKMP
jgi:hypothetical protein